MENNEVSASKSSVPKQAPVEVLKNFNLDTLKDMKSLDKFLPVFLLGTSFNLDKVAESIKNNPSFNYNEVVDIMKNLKSIDPSKQSQIESILTSKTENISNNAIIDIIKSLNVNNSKQEMKSEEAQSMIEETDTDSLSIVTMSEGKNLVENVRENLDKLIQSNSLKRKTTKKRWWTPEEVNHAFMPINF
jgi:hypothetical protein